MKKRREKQKAIFLDRDGVITEDISHLHRVEDLQFIPKAVEALQQLSESPYKVFIVSNQAVVGRGICTEKEFWQFHEAFAEMMKKNRIRIDGYYYCFHHPTAGKGKYLQGCVCRKPKPGMLLQAAEEHDIMLTDSYMVGDKKSDILAGKQAGCRTILVKTGYAGKGGERPYEATPDYTKKDLWEAVSFILGREGKKGKKQSGDGRRKR